ncbi:MAG: M14 metallopeptidase family protein [Bacteroidota bacterium]
MLRYLMLMSCLLWVLQGFSQSAPTLDYYLPQDVSYDDKIPTPAEVVGHEVGEFHITHDRQVYYMRTLADASNRVTLIENGYSHERRPQILLVITSPENHQNIEDIRKAHVSLTDPSASANLNTAEMPVVIWQGYTIHGNEASGANAALVAAYHYAAAQGDEIDNILSNAVILLDPSFNPDGMTRFATWANSGRSKNLVADPNNREQNEIWPGGRTNHYFFDLNRDWLPVQQPESQNRIQQFHRWKPNILTDHHEMGTNSTYFFQPGIPSRNNPNTPLRNFELTDAIAQYHAKALDDIGSLYYSKESFDDFYYGKGSTFPDINGGIGILFEQASSRGHLQESVNGLLSFPFTIRNQFQTSLSTVKAGVALRTELLDYQRTFFQNAMKEAKADENAGLVFGAVGDASRARALAEIMERHQIEIYPLKEDTRIDNKVYPAASSYFVPLAQPQYRLIEIMIQQPTTFTDSLFYDVSAWTMPLAFNLNFTKVDARSMRNLQGDTPFSRENMARMKLEKSDYAYAFKWTDYKAPALLNRLQQEGMLTKVAKKTFRVGEEVFDQGAIIIPRQLQDMSSEDLYAKMQSIQADFPVQIHAINSGNTDGVMLGSPQISTVEKPQIALLVEEGVRGYDAGEVWHLLDNRFDMEVTLMPIRVLRRADLRRYNTIIMVEGNYSSISKATTEKIKDWVRAGGKIIALKGANRWLASRKMINLRFSNSQPDSLGRENYANLSNIRGAQITGGTIFEADLDPSHPIGYGYTDRTLPIFVNSNLFFEIPKNPFAFPLQLTDDPLMSGYVSEENLARIKKKAAVVVSRQGRGRIVSFSFNPNFRAFWYGTNKLFLNAIYFGGMVDGRASE